MKSASTWSKKKKNNFTFSLLKLQALEYYFVFILYECSKRWKIKRKPCTKILNFLISFLAMETKKLPWSNENRLIQNLQVQPTVMENHFLEGICRFLMVVFVVLGGFLWLKHRKRLKRIWAKTIPWNLMFPENKGEKKEQPTVIYFLVPLEKRRK